RAEDNNTFDLNNLPDDPSIDFFPLFKEGSSSSSSSERETESLNKARELLRNNTFPRHQGPPFRYHFNRHCYILYSYQHGDLHIGDPITPYKPMMHPPRLFSPSARLPPPPLVQPYLYPPRSPTPPLSLPYRCTNDYYLHNNGTHHQTLANSGCGGRSPPESRYTFIGSPVANGSRVAPPLSQPLPPHHGYN
ncbi:hypothetical protein F2Q69_00060815, partial [Brassica cretica]